MKLRHHALALVSAMCLAACTATAASTPQEDPAKVEKIAGSELSRVTLTKDAAGRLGIRTEPVRAVAGGSAIPAGAIVYDKDGKSWAYTNPEPLTYVRAELDVSKVDSEVAVLRSGPAPGTPVVTVGAAELLGAEYGVEGE
jgi:hypothetical protein